MNRPLVLAAASLAGGIALVAVQGWMFWAVLIGELLVILTVSQLMWGRSLTVHTLLLAGFIIGGLIWAQPAVEPQGHILQLAGDSVRIEGNIKAVKNYPDRQELKVAVKRLTAANKTYSIDEQVLVVLYDRQHSWYPGDLVGVWGEILTTPSGGNWGEFNYRNYLLRRGLSVRIMAVDEQLISSGGPSLARLAAKVRTSTVQRVFALLPKRQAAVIVGMLLGERQYLDEELSDTFQDLGVMHVFAVSGLHVGFVAGILISLSALISSRFTKHSFLGSTAMLRFTITATGLIFYAALAGFTASVVRAVIMTLVGLFAYLVDRRKDFYNALAAAALVWLLYRPLALFDAGFQLSFVAAWGIYYLNPALDKLADRLPKWRSAVTVPLVAQLALAPLLVYHFGSLSLLTVVANIPVIYLAGAIILLALTALAGQFLFWPAAQLLLYSAGALVEIINRYLTFLGGLPFDVVNIQLPSPIDILIYYIVLVLVRELIMGNLSWNSVQSRLRWALPIAAVVIILVLAPWQQQLEVIFLDAGQGDAALVLTPGGRTIMIDAAGGGYQDYDVGRERLVPALHRLGVKQIDIFINSHPDRDHIGGLPAVVEEFPIGMALFPQLSPANKPELDQYLAILDKAGVDYQFVSTGVELKLDSGVTMEVLHPPKDYGGNWEINDQSLMLLLSYGANEFLFTGDVEQTAINYLLAQGGAILADVIKVPHHGSKGSFDQRLYRRVEPQVAVIPVGKNNFGHPDSRLVTFLQRQQIRVYRTDRQGAVRIVSDGKNLTVETVKQGSLSTANGL